MRPFAATVGGVLLVTALAACGSAGHDARGSSTSVSSAASTSTVTAPTSAAPSTATPTAKKVAAWTPCTTNNRPHFVYVSIAKQHLWMCAGARTNYSTGITSGMVGQYTNTPTGTFTIQSKVRNTTLNVKENGAYTAYPVKYWIPFDAPLFGFHDSSWQTFPYGSAQYKTAGSHGCVHVPLAAIAHLYNWAPVGTPVTIVA